MKTRSSKSPAAIVALRLLTFSLLSLSLWMISVSIAYTRQTEQLIPVKITKQLEPVNGVIPAEIRCGQALINTSNELAFTCKLTNNSPKKLMAAAVLYFVVIERNGVETKDEHSSVFVSLAGSRLGGLDKAAGPGEERSLGPAGPISYDDALIKGVEVSIDFVEFEDNLTFGPAGKGAEVVKDVREGAARYRSWIKRKYEAGRKSHSDLASLLESGGPLPAEIGLLNQNQEVGAKAYRRMLKKKSEAGDYTEVDKLLSQ